MLKINRLRIEINTENGLYGIDETFGNGINFIASRENTCGKSSIIAAIYYCLGFEQIIGGVGGIGSKVLTSVFKTVVEDNGNSWFVTESGAYLEISNGIDVITIYRSIKSEHRDSRLVSVFCGNFDAIKNNTSLPDDYYVHYPDSATSKKGFHAFLEEFLHMELPLVGTSDGYERKLYLQLVFSSMLIEQKHGWSDIMSGMPVFGVREAKKRTVEYVLGLDTIKTAKESDRLKSVKSHIEQQWDQLIGKMKSAAYAESCDIISLPLHPRILSESDCARIAIVTSNSISVSDEIKKITSERDSLQTLSPRVIDNFDALNSELSEIQARASSLDNDYQSICDQIQHINRTINRLSADLEIVNSDIRNNTDAARLQKMGSDTLGRYLSITECPVCKQHIQDSLIDLETANGFMNIEENIGHLKEQKKMLEFMLNGRVESQKTLNRQKEELSKQLLLLRRLANAIRSDLYASTDTNASEAIILKRMHLTHRIEHLSQLQNSVLEMIQELKQLSKEWSLYLIQKGKLPENGISKEDVEKIGLFKTRFIENLKRYHYSSLTGLDGIDISMKSSLLPTIDGFDMKFDSSASDGIRVIWAYTLALLQVSVEKGGNHPGLIVFDEPAQQSIVPEDTKSLIDSVLKIKESHQVIVAITLNSSELVDIINERNGLDCHRIDIENKAIKKL